ncbi:hypothetical protein KUV57_04285 [Epibacterium sp. DP7N7-1]|nr:hypothetical protein [Epibacterium sp. DP7N7-1]
MSRSDLIDDVLFSESGTHYRDLTRGIEKIITLEYSMLFAVMAFSGGILTRDILNDQVPLELVLSIVYFMASAFGLFCYSAVVGKQAAKSAHGALIRLKYLNKPSPKGGGENILVFFDKNRVMPRSPLFATFRLLRKNTSSDGNRLISALPPIVAGMLTTYISIQYLGDPVAQGCFNLCKEVDSCSYTGMALHSFFAAFGFVTVTLLILDVMFFEQKVHPNSEQDKSMVVGTKYVWPTDQQGNPVRSDHFRSD